MIENTSMKTFNINPLLKSQAGRIIQEVFFKERVVELMPPPRLPPRNRRQRRAVRTKWRPMFCSVVGVGRSQ